MAEGTRESIEREDSMEQENSLENNRVFNNAQTDRLQQQVCERFELSGLDSVTATILYHTTTRCISFSDTGLVRAGYGVTLRYRDKQGCEKSATREGTAIFFGLPVDICNMNYTVYLPNPVRTHITGCEVLVEFCALLSIEE